MLLSHHTRSHLACVCVCVCCVPLQPHTNTLCPTCKQVCVAGGTAGAVVPWFLRLLLRCPHQSAGISGTADVSQYVSV